MTSACFFLLFPPFTLRLVLFSLSLFLFHLARLLLALTSLTRPPVEKRFLFSVCLWGEIKNPYDSLSIPPTLWWDACGLNSAEGGEGGVRPNPHPSFRGGPPMCTFVIGSTRIYRPLHLCVVGGSVSLRGCVCAPPTSAPY